MPKSPESNEAKPLSGTASEPLRLPENVLRLTMSQRSWSGVNVDVAEFRCSGPVLHQLRYHTETRLNAVLEEAGSPCEPRLSKDKPCPIEHMPRHMHFAPAGMEVWGYGADPRFVKDATLSFDLPVLRERLGTALSTDSLSTPRLRFADDRIWTLVSLLSEAVLDTDPSSELYGDGLTAAITSLLLGPILERKTDGPGLTPWQLRRVNDYVMSHLPAHIKMEELATLAGLSESHFSRAFKMSTGIAPYRWQLEARIKQAQTLLLTTSDSLEVVASATGFADAVHFGRTFRKLVGVTPAAWRRDRQT